MIKNILWRSINNILRSYWKYLGHILSYMNSKSKSKQSYRKRDESKYKVWNKTDKIFAKRI